MAKHNCAICGVEVGLMSEQKLADGNYICRKVCSKKTFKVFDKVAATLPDVNAHIQQIEFGTKVWDQIFVPLKSTKNKEEKLDEIRGIKGNLMYFSPSTGLLALVENRYKFFIFGKTTLACVYRVADLYDYEYESEVSKDAEGKEITKHFVNMTFRNVAGLYNARLELDSKSDFFSMEKYFDKLFGIQDTIRNSINNAKRQVNAFKAVAGAVKAAANEDADIAAKTENAFDAMEASRYGDRTEWIKKADAALASVK